jgi:CheY-like chemotaxis protein/HPt (histidine-containing phosphotransfer) domain-containing protein
MAETFRKADVEVRTASNGEEAIAACRETDFKLVFMDCQMPVVDGFEATATIIDEAKAAQRDVPAIIALTADATQKTRRRCLEVGMVDYLVKPLDFNRLQQVLSNWVPDLPLSIIPGGTSAPVLPLAGPQGAAAEVISSQVLARLREHVGDLTRVAAIFLRSLDSRLAELEEAVRRKDAAGIQKVAHTMKGSCSQFGAEELARLCMLAEGMGKSGNLQRIDGLSAQIAAEAARVKHFFDEQLA